MHSEKFKKIALLLALVSCSFLVKAQNGNMADEVLNYVNKHRASIGLQRLEMNDYISGVAEKHSMQMARGLAAFGHGGFNNRVKIISKHIAPVKGFAENVTFGKISAKEVVKMWLHSKGHRENMEGNYNLTGIGIASARDGTLYFTQIFILKK